MSAVRLDRRLMALLVAAASAGYVCRVAVTVAAPGIMRDLHLSQVQMGTVFSAFLLGYTLFQVPSGWLADRVDSRRLFLFLAAGWTVFTAATAAIGWQGRAGAFALIALWVIRVAFGVLAAPTYPTAGRILALAAPPRLQARANSLVLASIGIGSALAPLLLAPINQQWGWRTALLAAAALGAAAWALWKFCPLAPATSALLYAARPAADPVSSAPDSLEPFVHPLRQVGFWLLTASYTLQGYLGYIFIFWFYLYLLEVRHLQVLAAAGFTALPWLASIAAIPLGGLLSDLAVQRWGAARGRRVVPVAALALAGVLLFIGARSSSTAAAVTALTGCTVLVLATEGPFWATMTQISGRHAGIGGGVMNFGSNLGGMISPALTPWLAARIGWESALSLTAALALAAAALWLGVRIQPAVPSRP